MMTIASARAAPYSNATSAPAKAKEARAQARHCRCVRAPSPNGRAHLEQATGNGVTDREHDAQKTTLSATYSGQPAQRAGQKS
jgi:hypothetical protein